MWLNGEDARDILCPSGYTPLSKNQEVLRCVYRIADLVSNMTIMLMENGQYGDSRVRNELSKKIDISPNQWTTRKQAIFKIVSDMCIYGNSVAYPQHVDGILENIDLWDASAVTFCEQADGYSIRYKSKEFHPDEVLHFVLNPQTDQFYKGQGVAPLITDTLSNLAQENATKSGFLKSKWKPSLIISINADIEELQNEEDRSKILGSYTKTTEVGEPWLIPAGEIDIKTVQPLTLNDLAIQDGITLDKKTLASALSIPGFMIGIGEFNKDEYNNFISTAIMSYALIIQQELSKKLLLNPKWYFKLSPKSLMQYAMSEKIQFVKEMTGIGVLNRNEGRGEFDYSPVDNEAMNEYTVLENYLRVTDLNKQKKLEQGGEDN